MSVYVVMRTLAAAMVDVPVIPAARLKRHVCCIHLPLWQAVGDNSA
jgi:hypothetical protein